MIMHNEEFVVSNNSQDGLSAIITEPSVWLQRGAAFGAKLLWGKGRGWELLLCHGLYQRILLSCRDYDEGNYCDNHARNQNTPNRQRNRKIHVCILDNSLRHAWAGRAQIGYDENILCGRCHLAWVS